MTSLAVPPLPAASRRRSVMSEESYARVLDDDGYYLQRMREILEGPPRGKPPVNHVRLWDHIYMGSQRNAEDIEALRRDGIQYVLSCVQARRSTESPYDRTTSGIRGFLLIPAEDREDFDISRYFDGAIKFLNEVRSLQPSGGRALIHCNMGVNRSGAVAAAYLMVAQRKNLLDVIADMKSKRNALLSNRGFRRQLVEFARSRGLLDPIVDTVTRITYSNPTVRSRSRDKAENGNAEAWKVNWNESATNGGSVNAKTRGERRVEKRNFVSIEGAYSDDEVASDSSRLRSRGGESHAEIRDALRGEFVKSVSFDERQRVHRRGARRERSYERDNKEDINRQESTIDSCHKNNIFAKDNSLGVVYKDGDIDALNGNPASSGISSIQIVTNSHENNNLPHQETASNSEAKSINIKVEQDGNHNAKAISSKENDSILVSKDYISPKIPVKRRDRTECSKLKQANETCSTNVSSSSLDVQLSKPNQNSSVHEVLNRSASSLPNSFSEDDRFSLTNPVSFQCKTSPRTRRSTITLGSATAPIDDSQSGKQSAVRTSAVISMSAASKTTVAQQPSKVRVATVTTPAVKTTTLKPVSQAKPSTVQKAIVTTPVVQTTTLQLVPQATLRPATGAAAVGSSAVQRAITLALVRPVAIGLAAVKPISTETGAGKRSAQWLSAVRQVAAASATAVSQVARPIAAGLIPVRLAALKLNTTKGTYANQSTVKPSIAPNTLMPSTIVKTTGVYQTAVAKSIAIKPAIAGPDVTIATTLTKTATSSTLTPATKDLSRSENRKTLRVDSSVSGKGCTVNADIHHAKKTSPGYIEVPIKITHMLHDGKQPVQSVGKAISDLATTPKEPLVIKKSPLLRGLSVPSETVVTKRAPVVIQVPVIKMPSINVHMTTPDAPVSTKDDSKAITPLKLEPVQYDQKLSNIVSKPLEQKKTSGTEIHLVPATSNYTSPKSSGTSRAALLLKSPNSPSELLQDSIVPLEIPKEDGLTEGRERISPGWYASYTNSPVRAILGTSSLERQSLNTTSKRLMPLQVSNTSSLGRASHYLEEPLTEPKRCSSASDRYIDPIVSEAKWGAYNSTGRPNSWATVSSSYDRPMCSDFSKMNSNISHDLGPEMNPIPGYRPMTDSGRHLQSDLRISNTPRNRWFTGLDDKSSVSTNAPTYRLFSENANRRDDYRYANNPPPRTTSLRSDPQPYNDLSPVSNINVNRSNDSFRASGPFSTKNSGMYQVDSNDRFGRNSFPMQSRDAGISGIDVKPMSNIQFHSMLRSPRTSAAFSSDQPGDSSQYSGFLVLLGTRRGVAGSVADLTMPSESTVKSPWKSASSWNRTPMNYTPMTTSFESTIRPKSPHYDEPSVIMPRTPRAYTRSRTDSEIIRQRQL